MTQKEKELLLKDLCARLPYGVKVQNVINGSIYDLKERLYCLPGALTTNFKPYLRPMSSMTEEEKAQVQTFMDIVTDENYGDGYSPSAWDAMNVFVQYCDSHHLDHRGLIFRGIALEAPEEMY